MDVSNINIYQYINKCNLIIIAAIPEKEDFPFVYTSFILIFCAHMQNISSI